MNMSRMRPLLSTPNNKRSRDQEDTWGTSPAKPTIRMTPATPRRQTRTPATPGRTQQTPINNYLVTQTVEEKQKILKQLKAKKVEMSASPKHKKTKSKLQAGNKGLTGASKKLQLKPGKVASILRFFETSPDVPDSSKMIVKKNSKSNNNHLSPPQLTQTDISGDRAEQQMAAQPNTAGHICSTNHRASQRSCDKPKTSPPISISQITTTQNSENSSHL